MSTSKDNNIDAILRELRLSRGISQNAILLADGSNYDTWARIMAAKLRKREEYDQVVTGTSEQDACSSEDSLTFLSEHVEPALFTSSAYDGTAHEFWIELKHRFQITGHTFHVSVFRNFIKSEHYRPNAQTAEEHAAKWRHFAKKALVHGIDITGAIGFCLFMDSIMTNVPTMSSKFIEMEEGDHTLDKAIAMFLKECKAYQLGRCLRQKPFTSGNGKPDDETGKPGQNRHPRPAFIPTPKAPMGSSSIGSPVRSPEKGTNTSLAISSGKAPTHHSAWLLDSGASVHISPNPDIFTSIINCEPKPIFLANGAVMMVEGTGEVRLRLEGEQGPTTLTLTDVNYVPSASFQLISVGRLADKGHKLTFSHDSAIITSPSGFNPIRLNRPPNSPGAHYAVTSISGSPKTALIAYHSDTNVTWREMHERLGHAGDRTLAKIASDPDNNTRLVGPRLFDCGPCHEANLISPAKGDGGEEPPHAGFRIHFDLIGKLKPMTKMRESYILSCIDAYSRYAVCFLLPSKSSADVVPRVVEAVDFFSNQTRTTVSRVRFDRGREFINESLRTEMASRGTVIETTAPNAPHQNGLAERFNRTIVEMTRVWLIASELALSNWGYAALMATFVYNRRPHSSLDLRTPHEFIYGTAPRINGLRKFGQLGYYIPESYQTKLIQKGRKCRLLGYSGSAKNCVVVDTESGRVLTTNKVQWPIEDPTLPPSMEEGILILDDDFEDNIQPAVDTEYTLPAPSTSVEPIREPTPLEETSSHRETEQAIPNEELICLPECLPPTTSAVPPEGGEQPRDCTAGETTATPAAPNKRSGEDGDEAADTPARKRVALIVAEEQEEKGEKSAWASTSQIIREGRSFIGSCPKSALCSDSPTLKQALASPDRDSWVAAIRKEFSALVDLSALTVVPQPTNMRILDGLLRLVRKRNAAYEVTGHKARFVARGDLQVKGIDYHESSSPVVNWSTVLMLLTVAAAQDMEVRCLDISNAFLNAPIDEELYVKIPYIAEMGDPEKECFRVGRSLYGLCQAGFNWNKHLDTALRQLGWKPFSHDKSAYRRNCDGRLAYLTVYVDDIGVFAPNEDSMQSIIEEIKDIFKLGRDSIADQYLGVAITRDRTRRSMKLDLSGMTRAILDSIGEPGARPRPTPLPTSWKGDIGSHAQPLNDIKRFQRILGSWMYIAHKCRPDIALATTRLGRFSRNPGPEAWKGLEHLTAYMSGTVSLGIILHGNGLEPSCLTDADFNAGSETSINTTGFVIMLGDSPVHWTSKRQSNVSASSRDSEAFAAFEASRVVVWTRGILRDARVLHKGPTLMRTDSENLIANTMSGGISGGTRHIVPKINYLKERIRCGDITLKHIAGVENPSDIFTKPLAEVPFNRHRETLGVK